MKIFVFGGTGFLGKFVVQSLLSAGHSVILLVHKRPIEQQEGIETIQGDVLTPTTYADKIIEADIVINLIGIIKEKGQITFENMHYNATKTIVDVLIENGPKRYIHTSALGITEKPVSRYFETKLDAENYVKSSGLDWTIFRPSLLWHEQSDFVQQLDQLVRIPLFTPVLGTGQSKFQVINVADAAHAYVNVLSDQGSLHQIIELGGPKVYTFLELVNYLEKRRYGKAKFHLKIPMKLAGFFIKIATSLNLPIPITYDQYRMLGVDNILSGSSKYTHSTVLDS